MNWDQLWLGLGLAVPATVLGYLAHRRSRQVDAASAQSNVASSHQAGTAQVIQGLNALIDQLQEDNTTFRQDIRALAVRLDRVTTERDALRIEVADLKKKYIVDP